MRFQCPFCQGIVSVDNNDLGIDVQCGHCNEIVTVPASRVATGAVIGDFIILQEIGRGGMGVVYLAHQMSLDRPAALKVLSDNYANNAEFVVGFIKEARAAAKLNHPNIVQAYAVGEDEGIFYFAMENIDGETMKNVLKREHMIPVDQALSIIQQIAEALDYAWKEQRLIHRDIKPDNIMLTSNGRAKLADLGLARVAEDIDDGDSDEVMGTPQYISPEHLTGAPMDVRSDIYSLGATFYQFVTGRFPFEGRTGSEIARKHLEEPLTPPNHVNPQIPPAVSHIIEKMMAKDPKMRYQDAQELVEDLRNARHGKEPLSLAKAPSGVFSNGTIHKKTPLRLANKSNGTATGTIQTNTQSTYTSSVTRTNTINSLKKIHEEQAKRRLIILGVTIAVIAAVIIAGAIYMTTSSGKPQGKPTQVQTPDKTPPKEEPKTTAYTKKANQILQFAKENPDAEDEIREKCEDFFKNFPKTQYKVEAELELALRAIYEPLSEKPVKGAVPEESPEEIKKRQEQAAREKAQAEAAERVRKAAEERAREAEATEKEINDLQSRLDNLSNEFGYQILSRTFKNDYKGALALLTPVIAEADRAKGKDAKVVALANKISTWGKNMAAMLQNAERIHNMLLNGGEKMGGSQFDIRSELCQVESIRNGVVTLSQYSNGKMFTMKLTQLSGNQYVGLVRKAAKNLNMESSLFFYYLTTRDFVRVQQNSIPDDWKAIVSGMMTSYLREELKNVSQEQREELQRLFGRLDEYRQASGN